MGKWFAWLNPAPLWQYIPVTLTYCLVATGAGYVAASLVSGNPAFARLPMCFLIGVPLSLFLTAYSVWRRYGRGPHGNGSTRGQSGAY